MMASVPVPEIRQAMIMAISLGTAGLCERFFQRDNSGRPKMLIFLASGAFNDSLGEAISPFESRSGWMDGAKTLKTTPRRIQLRIPAAFLFHQVIFGAPCALRCSQNIFPITRAFSKENLVAFRRIR